jgi:uncharacterized protein (TIGR02147 family)
MRSFARDLGLSPPRLSCILKGKYSLSVDAAKQVADRLKLSPEAQAAFINSVLTERAAKKLSKRKVGDLPPYSHLSEDQFLLVSEWYHFPILELTYLKDFNPVPNWIARRLGISIEDAMKAIERLRKLDLLRILKTGKYRPTSSSTMTPTEVSSDAIKKYHTQILDKAKTALQEQSVEERQYMAGAFSFNSEELAEAKKEVEDFANRFAAKFSKNKTKDSVYTICVQFFRLDKRP